MKKFAPLLSSLSGRSADLTNHPRPTKSCFRTRWMKSRASPLAFSVRSILSRRLRIGKRRLRKPKLAPRNGSAIRSFLSMGGRADGILKYVLYQKPFRRLPLGSCCHLDNPRVRRDRCQGDRTQASEDIARVYAESGGPDARVGIQFQAHASADEFRRADGPSGAVPVGFRLAILRSRAEAVETGVNEQEGRAGIHRQIL